MPLILTPEQIADAAQIPRPGKNNEAVVLDPVDEYPLRHLVAMHAVAG